MRSAGGFTLAELAIVMLIMALLGGGALSALRIQTQQARFNEARSQVAEAREALLNYAAVEKHLPCADADGDGQQDCGQPCAPRCQLPWATLGLIARDPWGQSLFYTPSRKLVSGGLSLSSMGELAIKDAGGALLANRQAVAFAIWSAGPDSTNNTSGSDPLSLLAEAAASDDILMWTSRYVLLGRMLEAGWDAPAGKNEASEGN